MNFSNELISALKLIVSELFLYQGYFGRFNFIIAVPADFICVLVFLFIGAVPTDHTCTLVFLIFTAFPMVGSAWGGIPLILVKYS